MLTASIIIIILLLIINSVVVVFEDDINQRVISAVITFAEFFVLVTLLKK